MIVMLVLLVTTLASAQRSPGQVPLGGRADVTDEELRAFAKTYVKYHRIREEYEPQLAKVKDPKERAKIQREGNSKVKQSLGEQGITAETYNRLFAVVNSNEQLRKKALDMIDAERHR